MTDKAYPNLTAATTFATGDGLTGRKSGETEDKSFSDSVLAAWILANVITNAQQQSVDASGTVYNLTASAAKIDFGTTDPSLTLTGTGTYRITGRCVINYSGATFAASQDVTIKLRRTNNTAADLTNGSVVVKTDIVTTKTYTLAQVAIDCIYTTSGAGDTIELWGSVAATPSAGNLQIASATIVAQRLQQ